MRALIENVDCINATDAGKALPKNLGAGIVELEMSGVGMQKLAIVSTRGEFGGLLRWFTCPACERRVGKLYLPAGTHAFLCRHCHKLGYRQQLLREFRKTQYERKIITRLEKGRKERIMFLNKLNRILRSINKPK